MTGVEEARAVLRALQELVDARDLMGCSCSSPTADAGFAVRTYLSAAPA